MRLSQKVEYSGDGSGASGSNGKSWVNSSQPRLEFDGGNVLLESGPTETILFQITGTGYKAGYFVRDVLTYDSTTQRYTVTSPDGQQKVFTQNGALESINDAHGNQAICTYSAGRLVSIVTGSGAGSVGYYYTFDTLGMMTEVVMRVGGTTSASDYRRVSYTYTTSGELEKALLEQKKAGAWEEVDVAYYRYYTTGLKQIRFVLGDHAYEQMHSVNPTWPESATDAQVAEYADAEYSYFNDGRVKQTKTNGGVYTYDLTYARSMHSGSTPNVWTSKTTVKMPDGSTQTFYYNMSLSLLLQKVSEPQPDGTVKTWYPICQQFDANTRIVASATSSAVAAVDESSPTLFTLKPNEGKIEVTAYDINGYKTMDGLQKGALGSVVKLREFTYVARTAAGQTIYVPATVTEYRDATDSSSSNPVTTSFAYTWYQNGGADTFQKKTVTTTLPAVPNAENGDAQTGTVQVTYDSYGNVIEQVDAVGTKTTYTYYLDKGALKQTVEDAGTGRLNLTTDYDVDPMGRTTLMKGPEHTISLNGTATNIRSTQWTQYLDTDDEVRSINGYITVADSNGHTINPVQISRHFVEDPEVSGGRMEESVAAVFSGSGVPPESQVFTQSDYVRLSTQHFSRQNLQTYSRVYHLIPASGVGANGTNYGQTSYGYDSAGRQNQVTSPEGTIHFTVSNAMDWALLTKVGTSMANLVTLTLNEYDGGAAGGDGNLTKATNCVDATTADNRSTLFRYDWRNRQVETETYDGTRTLLSHRTYDNRSNVTQADEYQNSITAANLINRAENAFDTRNQPYRSKRYGVEVGTGILQPALISETYYDQAGRTARSTPAGKVGFSAMLYDAVGRMKKQFRAYGGTLDLASPASVANATVIEQTEIAYNTAGNTLSTTVRQRFDNATGTGELQNPTTEPKARVSYAAHYPDGIGRTVATANYGTNGGAAWTYAATVPTRSDTVLVNSSVFNEAGEQAESMDPMGTVTRQEFDAAARMVKMIENYQP